MDKELEEEQTEIIIIPKLIYNHSTKPKTCLIGDIDLSRPVKIKLKNNLSINCLGFGKQELKHLAILNTK